MHKALDEPHIGSDPRYPFRPSRSGSKHKGRVTGIRFIGPAQVTCHGNSTSLPFVRSPYIGLSNLILNRAIVQEHLQDQAAPLPLARSLLRWLARPGERQSFYGDVRRLRQLCGKAGVWQRTAADIRSFLDGKGVAGRAQGS